MLLVKPAPTPLDRYCRMTDRDKWTELLRCPNCRATARVELSQASPASRAYHDGDQNVRVEFAPSKFRVAVTEFGCQFYCASCGVSAHHINPVGGGRHLQAAMNGVR
jgi:hypothetical protein